jgi:hypothetical protein
MTTVSVHCSDPFHHDGTMTQSLLRQRLAISITKESAMINHYYEIPLLF